MRPNPPQQDDNTSAGSVTVPPSVTSTMSDDPDSFVLNHPGISQWLKDAVATSADRDAHDVLNDLEILTYVLRARADRVIAASGR